MGFRESTGQTEICAAKFPRIFPRKIGQQWIKISLTCSPAQKQKNDLSERLGTCDAEKTFVLTRFSERCSSGPHDLENRS